MDVVLKLQHDEDLSQLVGYVESNFADDLNKYGLTMAYLFTLVRGPVKK